MKRCKGKALSGESGAMLAWYIHLINELIVIPTENCTVYF